MIICNRIILKGAASNILKLHLRKPLVLLFFYNNIMQKSKDINKSLDEQCSLLSGSAICQGFFLFLKKFKKFQKTFLERYNEIIKKAPVQFYALYVGLYVSNNTQSELAEKWKVGNDFIKKLNAKLCNYLESFLHYLTLASLKSPPSNAIFSSILSFASSSNSSKLMIGFVILLSP